MDNDKNKPYETGGTESEQQSQLTAQNRGVKRDRKSAFDEFHIDEDLCLDLLTGLLKPKVKRQVLDHMADCPDCEMLVQKRFAEGERSRSHFPDIRARLESEPSARTNRTELTTKQGEAANADGSERKTPADSGIRPAPVFRRPVYTAAAVFAAVVLVVTLFRMSGAPDGPELFLLTPVPADLMFRAETVQPPPYQLHAGLDAYRESNFELATELLAGTLELPETGGDGDTWRSLAKIYLGSALAWTGQVDGAVSILEPVVSDWIPEPWRGEGRWTLYVCLERAGREARADSMLRVMANEQNIVGERARERLRRNSRVE